MNTWTPSSWARRLKITSDWSLQLDNERLAITQHNTRYVTCRLWEVSAIRYAHGAVWSSCHIELSNPDASVSSVTLKGLTKQSATEVVDALRSRLNRYLLQTLKTRGALISRWQDEAFRQLHSDRWNRRSLLDRLHDERDNLYPVGEISNSRLTGHPALDELAKAAGAAEAIGNLRKAYSTELLQKAESESLRFVVVATPVEEIGRDHDFDWAVIEPSGSHSIVQTAGRVNRHRRVEVIEPNVLILQYNARALRGDKVVFTRPGPEGSEGFSGHPDVKDAYPDLERLLDWDRLDQLTAAMVFDAAHPLVKGELHVQKALLKEPLQVLRRARPYESIWMTSRFYGKYPLRGGDDHQLEDWRVLPDERGKRVWW